MKITLGDIFAELPKKKAFKEGIRRAPKRAFTLSEQDTKLALSNALRYVPKKWHDVLAPLLTYYIRPPVIYVAQFLLGFLLVSCFTKRSDLESSD
ncbi:MAG: hypothetical protein ACVCEJ_09310 [Candidatus Izemoplasmataceae bacterium]